MQRWHEPTQEGHAVEALTSVSWARSNAATPFLRSLSGMPVVAGRALAAGAGAVLAASDEAAVLSSADDGAASFGVEACVAEPFSL